MYELFRAGLAREPCHAFGRADVYGLKGISSAFDIKADGIHDGGYAPDGCSDRAILIDVAMDRLDP